MYRKDFNKTEMEDFSFHFKGAGHYQVTYTSPNTGCYWVALITDMTIIDATKNADCPLRKDMNHLKDVCKRLGSKYNKDGKRLN